MLVLVLFFAPGTEVRDAGTGLLVLAAATRRQSEDGVTQRLKLLDIGGAINVHEEAVEPQVSELFHLPCAPIEGCPSEEVVTYATGDDGVVQEELESEVCGGLCVDDDGVEGKLVDGAQVAIV